MTKSKKIISSLLVAIFLLALIVPAAAAEREEIPISFNGQSLNAKAYLLEGVTQIDVGSIAKIPGVEVSVEGYVPLRQFFEEIGAVVKWNDQERSVAVTWRDTNGPWTANELVVESNQVLLDYNTYKMTGTSNMTLNIDGPEDVPAMPEMLVVMDGAYQQQPLAMHMKQIIPMADLGLSEEELAQLGMTEMVTEIVWNDTGMYQKIPFVDQWIVQDFAAAGLDDMLNQLTQVSPQQSLEMMEQFGMFYTFGDDQVIDGKEYYVVNTYVDSAVFKQLIEEMLGQFVMPEALGMDELDDAMAAEFNALFKQMLESMELEYFYQALINKETLTTDYIYFDMFMSFVMSDPAMPGEEAKFAADMKGEFSMFDFGVEIQLPDVSNAMSQQEYFELMMQGM
ncbi:MAG: stalk domain-containing protein [Bacillota bacterium]|nr:stalk domain-containing protein [Bacillota bacterium]